MAGRQREWRAVTVAHGPEEAAFVTSAERAFGVVTVDIGSESKRGKVVRAFPGRAKRRSPAVSSVEVQAFKRRESAARSALQQQVFANPEDREIIPPIAVDIQRIGADNPGKRQRGRGFSRE